MSNAGSWSCHQRNSRPDWESQDGGVAFRQRRQPRRLLDPQSQRWWANKQLEIFWSSQIEEIREERTNLQRLSRDLAEESEALLAFINTSRAARDLEHVLKSLESTNFRLKFFLLLVSVWIFLSWLFSKA